MTGFDIQEPKDALIEAHANRVSDIVRRTGARLVPGTGRKDLPTSNFEWVMSKLAIPEEILSKAIGSLYSDDPKYDLREGVGNYHTQTGFADIFRDSGMGPVSSSILGIAAAILNPLDPVNKLKIFHPTKLGKVAEGIATAGDHLVQGADNLWRVSAEQIVKDIAEKTKQLETGVFHPEVEKIVSRSVNQLQDSLKHTEELNDMFVELQKRGVTLDKLKLAGSTYEQVRAGQRHLVGFGPILSHGLDTRSPSVYGFGGKVASSLVKTTSDISQKLFNPLKEGAYKIADYIGIPTTRTEAAKKLAVGAKNILDNGKATFEEKQRDLLSTYIQFAEEGKYGPNGKESFKEDVLKVLQALDLRNSGVQEMAIATLDKLDYRPKALPRGLGVTVEQGGGLSDEQKLRLTQSGVEDSEIPIAISQFDKANTPSIRIGKHGEHEAKLLGRYVVIKTSDPKAAASALDDLDGIYGNRVWAKHERNGEVFLIQKRHPGASRITKTDDFDAVHLRNLETIAAQLSNDKKGFTVLKPEDLLVSPMGAVQIINPSVIVAYKGQKEAVANSKAALDNLADLLAIPRGSSREFPHLKNTNTARAVPRGVDGLAFRSIIDPNIPEGVVVHMNAHDLLEQAINTAGYRDYVRAFYNQIEPKELAKIVGDPVQFERSNDIAFHRKQIRDAIAQGLPPNFEPLTITMDANRNLYVASHPNRLVAAILEGYETVPVYNRGFIGEVAQSGFYRGKSVRLTGLWQSSEHSSGASIAGPTRGLVATNYSLIQRSGEVIKLTPQNITTDPRLPGLFNRFVTTGLVGKGRNERIKSVIDMLEENTGGTRNALIRLSEMAEASSDVRTFVAQVESLLVNPRTKQGIKLDNAVRHPEAENIFIQFKDAATENLDHLASGGVLTTQTVNQPRRVMLASDANDLVVQVMDSKSNTLKVYGNQATTGHLQTTAESFINKTTTAADVEPYAKIELNGADGQVKMEVKDLVQGPHPRIAEVMEPVKVFTISKEHRKLLQSEGIYVADAQSVDSVRQSLKEKGLNFGVLLGEQERTHKALKTGQFVAGETDKVIVRPEFTFFVSPSGAMVVSTKHANVQDLLHTVFEEGPAYFEEFGVMTTGKIIVSNPFGGKMTKIGAGEVKFLEDRIQLLAERFRGLGFSDGTVLDIKVPFDNAVWRSMYGERVTVGDVLSDKFKLDIPEQLKGHVPDIHVLAPGRLGGEANEMGVVATEKTRLGNERLQGLFDKLANFSDKLFLEQAKAGIPISYYSSWFGRNLSIKMKEASQEAWLNYPDKQSKTFKYLEAHLKGRVVTDLTSQEFNTVIKRLQKEGEENAAEIISDVVSKYRDGYVLDPTKQTVGIMTALSKITPEGIDFWHLDPIWNAALSAKAAVRATTRKEIVDSIKDLGIAVWHGSVKELNAAKIGKNKQFVKLEQELANLNGQLTEAQLALERFGATVPDLQGTQKVEGLKQKIDQLTNQLDAKNAEKLTFSEKLGKGKVMDTMVDLESEQVWMKGEDLTRLIDDGVINPADVLGDPSDAFVRVPIKKYASLLDKDNQEVFLFPKEVAGVVQKYFQTTTKDGFGKFLSVWDTVQHLWRNWTLFPIPAYHIRNGLSNMFMAYLGDVTDPTVYNQAFSLMQIIDGHRKGALSTREVQEALGAMSFGTASGQVITGQQVFDEFSRHGGLAGALNYNEFTRFKNLPEADTFGRLSVEAGLTPSSDLSGSWLFDNAVLRAGVSAAAFVENRFRLATFIDALTKGRVETKAGQVITGFDAAAMHMKRVFYDYSDLSAFERSWLRRVIPFYSWSRHNIPRMLETVLTDPIKHYRMAEMFHSIETGATDGAPVDENDLPEWIRDKFGLIIDKDKKTGHYLVQAQGGVIPMTDAYKLLSGKGISSMITDGLTPFVKVPLEQFFNYSLYSDRPIEDVPGQRAQSYTLGEAGFSRRVTTQGPLGVLNILLNESLLKTFFRPGGELTTKILDPIFDGKEGPSIKLGILALAIGKAYDIDPRQAKMSIFKDWKTRQSQILGIRNQAVRQGDTKSVEDADRMLTWLRMQAPGATER